MLMLMHIWYSISYFPVSGNKPDVPTGVDRFQVVVRSGRNGIVECRIIHNRRHSFPFGLNLRHLYQYEIISDSSCRRILGRYISEKQSSIAFDLSITYDGAPYCVPGRFNDKQRP